MSGTTAANNQYTWVIEQMDCIPEANGLSTVVSTVHWRINATDANTTTPHTATAYGVVKLDPPDSNSYISYANLTINTVVSWVSSQIQADAAKQVGPSSANTANTVPVVANQVAMILSSLDTSIAKQITPPVIYPNLPWANT